MNIFFLENFFNDNILGDNLIKFFLNDKQNQNSLFLYSKNFNKSDSFINKEAFYLKELQIIKNHLDLDLYLKDDNIFIFNTDFSDEYKEFGENYIDKVVLKLNEIFEITKNLCVKLIENRQKASFYFFTVNPTIYKAIDFPVAPIFDEAIHSFIKSMAKEMTSFDIYFYGICLDPIFEMLNIEQIKSYRKIMSIYSLRKAPTKINDLLNTIQIFFKNRTKLFSGNIYNIGDGMSF
ncbi:MAG: hypothetical protein LBF97_00990 [Elusimicrobiota bacterium]|jgi:hypothetical protein|nr:hypothetical protein [Elusimicrobiota bacterium]